MKAKGQSAMEYMTTYGWAVLIVGIIGVVLWQLGLFDFGSRVTAGSSGFSVLLPTAWSMGEGSCVLYVDLANGAGEELTDLEVNGVPCTPDIVQAGGSSICSKAMGDCGKGGESYSKEIIVTYHRSSDNQSFQTAGEVWGNIEG